MAQLKRRSPARRFALLAAALAVGIFLRRNRWSPVRVEGDSMAPTLPAGSLVAVAPLLREPTLGSVVVVRRPDGSEHLKRVVGTPGNWVRLGSREMVLGPAHYAIAGDNRDRSTDSRQYGPVARDDLAAVARVCYWPPRNWRLLGG